MKNIRLILAAFTLSVSGMTAIVVGQPEYEIVSLGQMGEPASGGQAVSSNGAFGTGFSDQDPFLWSNDGTITPLPSLPGRPFSIPWAVNDAGTIAGIGATTFFGSNPLPVIWKNGNAIQLSLPPNGMLARAYGVNNSELVVGSVGGGSGELAAMFSESMAGMLIPATLPGGGVLRTAYAVNNDGRIVGQATDPSNAAVTKGFYIDDGDTEATDIGALTAIGHNSAIAFDVCDAGFITGSSSLNSGVNGRAFLWNETEGMIEIPLPAGASTASGRGVNDQGWVVGTAGGTTSLPFLFDGKSTWLLQDIIVAGGAGWDLISGTSNGAFSISDNGTILGRALFDGQVTAFAMIRLQTLLGDVNRDGAVNLLDVAPFVDLINDGQFQAEADINQDGFVNLLDVAPFVELLTGS